MPPAGTVLHNSKNEWEWLKFTKVERLSPRSPHHRSVFPYTKEDGLFYGGLTSVTFSFWMGPVKVCLLHYFHPSYHLGG